MTEQRNFRLYMAATASWFFHFGIQMVLFAWLVAIELHESADRVGLAQTAMMLPSLLFILIGGVAADRFGGRRVAGLAQLIAGVAPLVLAVIVARGGLSYTILILYALWIGVCQAFIAPARDGMLTQVSGADIQRTVIIVTGVQFGMQLVGFAVAAAADLSGPVPLMVIQSLAILAGALCYLRLRIDHVRDRSSAGEAGSQMVRDGIRHVLRSEVLRAAMILTFSVGILFMGVFMVGIPLLLRDLHDASPADLAFANVCNVFGIILTIAYLLKRGGIRARRGRWNFWQLGYRCLAQAQGRSGEGGTGHRHEADRGVDHAGGTAGGQDGDVRPFGAAEVAAFLGGGVVAFYAMKSRGC